MPVRSASLRPFLCAALSLLAFAAAPARSQDEAPAFRYPQSIAATKTGVVATDRKWPAVLSVADGKLAFLVRGATKLRQPLNAPASIAANPDGVVFVGDLATREVYRIEQGKEPAPLVGGAIGMPTAIACDGQGTLFVADVESHTLWKVADTGGKPTAVTTIKGLRALAFDAQGRLWSLAASEPQLARVELAEGQQAKLAPIVAKGFRFPQGLAVKGDDEWFVSDPYDRKISTGKGDASPSPALTGDPLVYPTGLALDSTGSLLVADPHAKKLWRVSDGKAEAVGE